MSDLPDAKQQREQSLLTYVSSLLSSGVLIPSLLEEGRDLLWVVGRAVGRLGLDAQHVEADRGPVDGLEHLQLTALQI